MKPKAKTKTRGKRSTKERPLHPEEAALLRELEMFEGGDFPIPAPAPPAPKKPAKKAKGGTAPRKKKRA